VSKDNWLDKMVSASPAARQIAWTGELRFAGAREDDKIGRTAKFDIITAPEDVGKANPFAPFTRRRAGHAGSRFHMGMSGIEDAPAWNEEVMLLGWSDGPKGQTVTFLLQPQGDQHPFMRVERGAQYMAVMLEISDDEQIVDQVKRERLEKAPQKLSNAAAQIIKNLHYWEWHACMGDPVRSAAEADKALKGCLDIESKRELDHDAEAVRRFRAHMSEFEIWQKEKGYL
jgi:hypothetical protein